MELVPATSLRLPPPLRHFPLPDTDEQGDEVSEMDSVRPGVVPPCASRSLIAACSSACPDMEDMSALKSAHAPEVASAPCEVDEPATCER
eukprot:scaffold228213_cov30-Tisochrysis_lutea.AAC.2